MENARGQDRINYFNTVDSQVSPLPSQIEIAKYHKSKKTQPTFLFNLASKSEDIYDVHWSHLIGVEVADSGDAGVFLWSLDHRNSLVVKGGTCIPAEYFTNLLYKRLNIKVPEYRVVQFGDKEFKKMIIQLQATAVSEHFIRANIRRELDRPFVAVMEYIPHLSFLTLGYKRNVVWFNYEHNGGYRRLRQLGEIIAADLFVNYSERVPVIWNNEGNPNNFLFKIDTVRIDTDKIRDPEYSDVDFQDVVSIDAKWQWYTLDDPLNKSNFATYMQKLDRYVRLVFADFDGIMTGKTLGDFPFDSMQPLKDFFHTHCNLEISGTQLFQLLKGVIRGFDHISQLEESAIEEIWENVRQLPVSDWGNIWAEGLHRIQLPFLYQSKSVIGTWVEENEEAMIWLDENYELDEGPLYLE